MRAAVIDHAGRVVNTIVADASADVVPGYRLVDVTSTPHINGNHMYARGLWIATPEADKREADRRAAIVLEAWAGG